MKAVSRETWEKITRLNNGNFWSRVFNSEEQVELLHEIGCSGESAAIPALAPLLVDTSGPIWRAAVEAIHRLFDSLSPFDLIALDHRMRSVGDYETNRNRQWKKIQPSDIKRFASSDFATNLLGLASFHNSGYVREAAIKQLLNQNDSQELPFLLVRLNDWVLPVREIAAEGVNARLRTDYAPYFLSNLLLVLHLRTCGRVNHALVDAVTALLRRAECKEALLAGMHSKDKALRRASFQLAAGAEQSSRLVVIKAALTDADSVARAWATKLFLPEINPEELPAIASSLLSDRFMPVRRDALWALAAKRPDVAADAINKALLDSHVGMREVARHFLSSDPKFNAREFYLGALKQSEKKTLATAIRGLGENGIAEDVLVAGKFINSPNSRERRAAVYAIGKLDPEQLSSKITQLLGDEMPGVSREALKVFQKKAWRLSLEELWLLFTTDTRRFVRRNALTLILHFGKWQKLPYLLFASIDADAIISNLAQDALRDWFKNYNHSFEEPKKEDLGKIQEVLRQVGAKLDKKKHQEINACLKLYFPHADLA